MANLLVFSEDDILGSVTHVDTEWKVKTNL